MSRIQEIMNRLHVDEETAERVLYEMEISGLDFSECEQSEFDAAMDEAYEAILALRAIKPSHSSTKAAIERIAELQIAHYKLTDTVDEYIQKTKEQTAKKIAKRTRR